MALSRHTPTVVAERRMRLSELVEAREEWSPRPCWSAIFLKAFGAVAARNPVLRRTFMPFPRPHLYEHPVNVASVAIERRYAGEEAVFIAQARSPEEWDLHDLDAFLRHCKEAPLETVGSFRRVLRQAQTPWPIRPLLWWVTSSLSGRMRSRLLGTFGLTSVGAYGAGLARVVSPLTTTLHFGLFDAAGNLDVRLSFDHRVLDGATAARALSELEDVLVADVLDELRLPAAPRVSYRTAVAV
jgi:hypothetical protein